MTSLRMISRLAIAGVAAPSLVILLGVGQGRAQTNSANYTFLIAAGFLCDSGDSAPCPAVVKSAEGASYELRGAGTLAAQRKLVTAAGTYTHKSRDGNVLETGVWVANELVSFDSYGIAPDALLRERRALGPPQFGPMRMGMFSGPMATGGLAVFRIRLMPVLGLAKNATLQVNCALGKAPAEHPNDGIRLAIEGHGAEFDEEISGRALFLLTRPGASTAAKAPNPEVDTNPAPNKVQQ